MDSSSAASSSSTTVPMMTKKPSNKCCASGCSDRAVKIVGDCKHCVQKFCSKHRLPEAHSCHNLQSCREESMAKFSAKMMSEKCVASKV